MKIKDVNVREYVCKLTARGVPAYCIEVDATVMEHEFVLWLHSFPFQQRHEVVAINFSEKYSTEKVRVDTTQISKEKYSATITEMIVENYTVILYMCIISPDCFFLLT